MARYRSFVASAILIFSIVSQAHASGPLGTIHVGTWFGGAFTDSETGAFSHCAAAQPYGSGVTLTVGESSDRTWLVGFTDPSVNFPKGATFPIDITFDGQAQFHLVAVASSPVVAAAVLPDPAVSQFRKSHLMVLQGKTHTLQFPLSSTDNLAMVIENCVTRMNDGGLSGAGDFSIAAKKSITSTEPAVPFRQARAAEETASAAGKSPRLTNVSGTGFVISTEGHIVTNNHVIKDCVGDVQGNFVEQAPTTLRVVATDEINDLALLQAKGAKRDLQGTGDDAGNAGSVGRCGRRYRISLPWAFDIRLHRHDRNREFAQRHSQRYALSADQRARAAG